MLCKCFNFRSRPCDANRTRQSIPKHNTPVVFVTCANRYMPYLNELYARFEEVDFKTRFQSIIHHPLNEVEFEATWQMMLNDFHLHKNNTLVRLYEIHKDWVPAFFKGDYCGLMVSTQRSKNMNKLVKSAHVDANTSLHQFTKQMMKLLHSRKMKEAKEALGCMVSDKMNNICLNYLTKNGE
jgi:hypothetical protein